MFAARCLGGSLAFFLVIYIAASFVISVVWELITPFFRGHPKRQTANLLFGLRMFPFGFATLLTSTLCAPSFVLLEPHTSREAIGLVIPTLGAGCVLVLTIGFLRAAAAQRKSARAIANWLQGSSRLTLNFDALRHQVGVLVTLGTVPLTMAALFTVMFTLPSYGLLDQGVTDEGICLAPLVLGAGCLLIMSVGIARVLLVTRETMYALAEGFPKVSAEGVSSIPVFQASASAPTLTVVGIRTPKVLVSPAALAALSEPELQGALRHEIAHMDSHDNFKKLLLRSMGFPGMSRLERAWSDAAEMAADDAAVSSLPQALDLASALIKISRITPVQPAEFTTCFLQGPVGLSTRVQRLFAWKETDASKSEPRSWFIVPPATVAVACVIAFYVPMLVGVHTLMERLLS